MVPFQSKGPWRSALNAVHGKASREYDPTELKVYLADISPISPLYLPYISPASPLHLPCISPVSRAPADAQLRAHRDVGSVLEPPAHVLLLLGARGRG